MGLETLRLGAYFLGIWWQPQTIVDAVALPPAWRTKLRWL